MRVRRPYEASLVNVEPVAASLPGLPRDTETKQQRWLATALEELVRESSGALGDLRGGLGGFGGCWGRGGGGSGGFGVFWRRGAAAGGAAL